MKRILTLVLTAFILSGLAVSLLACGQDSDSTAVTEEQVVAVQRGDLIVDITAVGNLAFSYQEELIFGVGGTVSEFLVEVGDSVEEGQVLAKLDDTSIISLQKAVVQAEINLEQAEINLEQAEINLEQAQNPYTESDIIQAELSVINAEMALKTAEENLEKAQNPYTESNIVQAELAVINAEAALDRAQESFERAEEQYNRNWTYPPWILEYEQTQKKLALAEFDLAEAEETLAEMQAGADPLDVEQKQKQLAVAQANLKEAEDDLAEIQAWIEGDVGSREVELKQLEVERKQLEVATAQAAMDEAIERLEMDTIVAPFAGVTTSVNVEAGEAVNASTVVIELVDTDKFEAEILVNEMDFFQIKLGGQAWVQVDAMPGLSLPAKVAHISPTAIIQQGVVNYKVKVETESLQSVMQERQEAMQGELHEGSRQSTEEGSLTQEQLEEMMKQRQQAQAGQPEGQQRQMPTIVPEDFKLAEGLTVTVSLIVEQKTDVLLVPNSAITMQGGQAYVHVLTPDGTIEERAIMTGISNWQYTEVIEGLSEGEKVVIPETATTTPTTPEQWQRMPGGVVPGMERMLP